MQLSPLGADGCPLPKPCHTTPPPPSQPAPCLPSSLPCPVAFHLLSAGAWAERFTLHMATGELRTATVLRRSDRAEYIFTVTASDRGTVPRSTSAIIRIQVSSTLSSSCPCTIYPLLASQRTPSNYLAAFLCLHLRTPCSAVDPALKSVWRTWDGKGWVHLPLCMFSFVKWSTALIVSSSVFSRLRQTTRS